MKKRVLILSFALALLASACAPAQNPQKNTNPNEGANTQASDSQKGDGADKDAEEKKDFDIKEDETSQGNYLKTLVYSNLYDKETQDYVTKALKDAGLSEFAVDNFILDVKEFNDIITDKSLVKSGFSKSDSLEVSYDVEDMTQRLESADSSSIGNNCRITTFGLMHDIISAPNGVNVMSDNLFFDFDSINHSKKLDEKQIETFGTVFGKIPTQMVQETQFQVDQVKKAWKERGLSFKEGIKASMISVLFHDEPLSEGENSFLFVGHVGVLVPVEDGKFLFVEKLTFQEPYQAILFDSKVHLNDYLMNKYDTSWGQPTARPFIMENGELLEGYRLNPNTKQQ